MKNEIFVKMVLDAWNAKFKQVDKLFKELSDEQLEQEIAPGRNRGKYLLGHLAATNNYMLTLLGWSSELPQNYFDMFVKTADRNIKEYPDTTTLRQNWNKVHSAIATHFQSMQLDNWFEKHTAVSEADFAKEPHRNKLNVVISRTNHMDYHAGQIILLTSQVEK